MLRLIAQPDPLACDHCGRLAPESASAVPAGWDAIFHDHRWTMLCCQCRLGLAAPVFAVLRPDAGEVALFVGGDRDSPRVCVIGLGEARALHATLGQALRLADNPGGLA